MNNDYILESSHICNGFFFRILQNMSNYLGVKIVKKSIFLSLAFLITGLSILVPAALAAPTYERNPEGFVHGLFFEVDGEDYYFGQVSYYSNEKVALAIDSFNANGDYFSYTHYLLLRHSRFCGGFNTEMI